MRMPRDVLCRVVVVPAGGTGLICGPHRRRRSTVLSAPRLAPWSGAPRDGPEHAGTAVALPPRRPHPWSMSPAQPAVLPSISRRSNTAGEDASINTSSQPT